MGGRDDFMCKKRFKKGDVVKLKSGGRKMTICGIEDDVARCAWNTEADTDSSDYPIEAIRKSFPTKSIGIGTMLSAYTVACILLPTAVQQQFSNERDRIATETTRVVVDVAKSVVQSGEKRRARELMHLVVSDKGKEILSYHPAFHISLDPSSLYVTGSSPLTSTTALSYMAEGTIS